MGTVTDQLRFEVVRAKSKDYDWGFQVLIFVNGEEMTAKGAGLGMPPSELLLPANRFASPATEVPIARCTCGVYGCGATDIDIEMDDANVLWTWRYEAPMDRAAIFDRAAYDAEVARLASDHSWETRNDEVERLVMTGVDHDQLRAVGITISWIAVDYENSNRVRVEMTDHSALRVAIEAGGPYEGHGFVVDWGRRTPAEMAELVIERIHALRDSPNRVAAPVPEYRLARSVLDET